MRLRLVPALAMTLSLLAATPAPADTTVSTGDTANSAAVTADATGPVYLQGGGGVTRLRAGLGPLARNLPVPGQATAGGGFRGIALGTDSRGARVLAYTRCAGRRGCRQADVYTFAFGSRKETKVRSVSRSACVERNPVVVRGTLVFVREARKSRTRSRRCAGGIFRQRPGKKEERIARVEPFSMAYDGAIVTYAAYRGATSEIRTLRPGGPSTVLASATGLIDRGNDYGTILSAPTLAGGQVYWVSRQVSNGTDLLFDVVRRPADGSRPAQTLDRAGRPWVDANGALDADVSRVAVAGDAVYYVYAFDRLGLVSPPALFG